MQNFNIRDLTRGLLVGLIAGTGYLIAYKIVILFTENTKWAGPMRSLGWLIASPVLAFLFSYFSKFLKKDERLEPIEPSEIDEDDDLDTDADAEDDDVEVDEDDAGDAGD